MAAQPTVVSSLTSTPGITMGTWQEGSAHVVHVHDPSFPIVRFVVGIRSGALRDGPRQAGCTRMMLEMLLRGTKAQDRAAFNRALETCGIGLGCSVSHELASLRGVCLTRHLPMAWTQATEALLQPRWAPDELALLKQEVQDSLIGARDDDDAVAEVFLRPALYGTHPMAQAPGGEAASVEELTLADLQAAHGQIAADDVIIGFAGDIDASQARTLAAALVHALPATSQSPKAQVPPPAAPRGRIFIVDKPDRTQVQLRLATLPTGVHSGAHQDMESLWLGATAFAGTFTSPYTREVRDKRGWSYVAHGELRRLSLLTPAFVLRTAPALADALPCLSLTTDLYGRFAAGEIDSASLTLARAYLTQRYPFQVAHGHAMLPQALMLQLLNLPLAQLQSLPARLEAMDLTQVPAIVQQQLSPNHWAAVLVGPAAQLESEVQRAYPKAEIRCLPYTDGLLEQGEMA